METSVPPTTDDRSFRIAIIASYLNSPPTTEYSRGYFACLMDEAANDIDDAASDEFEKALSLVGDVHRVTLMAQRANTLR